MHDLQAGGAALRSSSRRRTLPPNNLHRQLKDSQTDRRMEVRRIASVGCEVSATGDKDRDE